MASKSLGTLTLDLVAKVGGFVQGMDKAQRESAKWRKQVERDLQTIQGGIDKSIKAGAAAAVAATATIAALTKKGLDAVNSQAALAQSLDTTYDSITALQMAAGDVGLEGLEGSLTRLNRRLGAAEVGSGAAAGAVKALNLDLEALSQMDADERVATIADAIRDSGVSMQRAARFAQDLGFEQQQAAEFFMQGGDAIRAYRGEVDQLGLSLNAVETAQIQDAMNAMGIFGDLTKVVSQRLAVEFAPLIRQVATDVESAALETGGFSDEISGLVDKLVRGGAFVVDTVDGVSRVVSTLGNYIALTALGAELRLYQLADAFVNGPTRAANEFIDVLNMIPGIDIAPRELGAVGQGIQQQIEFLSGAMELARSDIQAGLLEPLAGERLIKYWEGAKVAAEDAAKAAGKLRQQAGGSAPGDAPKVDAIEKEISALERAAATWGMSADEVKLYGLEVQGATEAQLGRARAALEDVAAMEKAKEHQEAYLQLVKDLRTDEEKLTDQLHERLAVLDAIAAAGGVGSDEYQETARRIVDGGFADAPDFGGVAPEIAGPWGELNKIDEAQERLQEWYDTQLEMLEEFRAERADLNAQWDEQELALKQEHEEKLAQIEQARSMAQLAAAESLFGDLADITKTFAGEQSGIYKTMFAIQKAASIAQSMVAIQTGIAMAAANPFPMNLAAMASVAAATASIVGNISAIGMAHEGIDKVPKTGTWLLEKGERVTTAETSAKLDRTLDQVQKQLASGGGRGGEMQVVINNNAPARVSTQRVQTDKGQILKILVDDLNENGPLSRTMQSNFGMSYAGR